jgi:hypothetical protein
VDSSLAERITASREQRFVSLASAFLLLVLGKIEVINFTVRVHDSVVQVQVPLVPLVTAKEGC